MAEIRKTEITAVDNRRINVLYNNISNYINVARSNVVQTINIEQVKAYWFIGRDIIEEEQAGEERAQYGMFLLKEISARLTKEFGKGFSVDTLERARKFYLVYSNVVISKSAAVRRKLPELSEKLGWAHYRALIHEPRQEVRSFSNWRLVKIIGQGVN